MHTTTKPVMTIALRADMLCTNEILKTAKTASIPFYGWMKSFQSLLASHHWNAEQLQEQLSTPLKIVPDINSLSTLDILKVTEAEGSKCLTQRKLSPTNTILTQVIRLRSS